MGSKDIEYFTVNIVGACRAAQRAHSAVGDIFVRKAKQPQHQPAVDPRKRTAEKRDLNIAVGGYGGKRTFYYAARLLLVKFPRSRYRALIAENAVVRAPEVRYEDRNVYVPHFFASAVFINGLHARSVSRSVTGP